MFREEYRCEDVKWLPDILHQASYAIRQQCGGSNSRDALFRDVLKQVRADIQYRLARQAQDAELARLLQIANSGQIFDPIQRIFDILADQAADVYRSSRRQAVLTPDWLNEHPGGARKNGSYADPYHFTALTKVQGQVARVELRIHLDRFDERSFFAMPAVLTHELVGHAYAQEDRNAEESIWAEGLMDWAAAQFFRRWAPKIGLPLALTTRHGEEIGSARRSAARMSGWSVATDLFQWFMLDQPKLDDRYAENLTLRFALEHNVTAASLPAKDALAARLMNIRSNYDLQRQLRRWRDGELPPGGLLQ